MPGTKTNLKDVAKYLDDISKHKEALKIIGGTLAGFFLVSKATQYA
ncbi:hypothetical protein [Secundilactobacillus oryzae]|nr:hypothetical protein [Secundilactobacillus oryzae]